MSREPETLDDAVYRVVHGSPPSKARGRVWYDVAKIFYYKLVEAGIVARPGEDKGSDITHADDIPHGTYPEKDPVELCSVTGKRSYSSETVAIARSQGINHTVRTYFCNHCRTWHVTKREGG